jgi:hypothetical protein
MKKIFTFLTAVLFFCFAYETAAQTVDFGTTGDCTWTLTGSSGDYTLTIGGNGAMENYTSGSAPWYSYRNDIKTLEIQQGVTTIGDTAFYDCTELNKICLKAENPPSVGNDAFYNVQNNIYIHVPCGKNTSYQDWGGFLFIIADIPLNVTLQINDAVMGTVGIIPDNDCNQTITAVANSGYHFVQWNDGNTENPRSITVTQDTVFVAEFAENIRHTDGIIYVTTTGAGNGNGSSWQNAYKGLTHPLIYADHHNPTVASGTGDSIRQIWVAEGVYCPAYKAGNGTQEREKAFVLVPDVKIYGGFAGTETDVSQRDISAHVTTLSGDTGVPDDNSDNCYHVVTATGNAANDSLKTAVLDGFTITRGNANGNILNVNGCGGGIYFVASSPVLNNIIISENTADNSGGGMCNTNYSSPVLSNVTVRNNSANNSGGGIFNDGGMFNDGAASPELTNVIIHDNSANNSGGGIYNRDSSPKLTNVIIRNNSAYKEYGSGGGMSSADCAHPVLTNVIVTGNHAPYGGGIENEGKSYVTLINVLISGNSATYGGGIVNDNYDDDDVYYEYLSPEWSNVTIVGNTASDGGGGICNLLSSPKIYNSIIWGNTANGKVNNVFSIDSIYYPRFAHSLVQGSGGSGSGNGWDTIGTDVGGNIDIYPFFKDEDNGDYRLNGFSPAINAGDADSYLDARGITVFDNEKDLAGNPRKIGTTIDMGAYENKESQIAPDSLTATSISITAITLKAYPEEAGVEYEYHKGATGTWLDLPTFENLTPNTPYIFYTRKKANEVKYASDSIAATFTTLKAGLSGKVAIDGDAVFGKTLSADTSKVTSTPVVTLEPLSYQWKRGDLAISDATVSTYTLTAEDVGKSITVTVKSANCLDSVVSTAVTVVKAPQTTLSSTTLVSKTSTSITLDSIAGVEYSENGTNWQDSPTFDGLTPNTSYSFYSRIKATDTHEASPASVGFTVKTFDTQAELINLSVNNIPIVVADTMTYIAQCGDHSATFGIKTAPTALTSVVANGTTLDSLTNISFTKDMKVTIRIVSEDGKHENIHVLLLYSVLKANDILLQRWSDVLAVNSNPAYNGNYTNIDSVRWYHNDKKYAFSKEWYIKLDDRVENYRAEINLGGTWHNVCGLPKVRTPEKVIAYPNPVSVGDNLNLHLPTHFAGGHMNVITLSGATVKHKLPLPNIINVINVSDWSPGVYLLNIADTNGNVETVKIIVN